MKECIGFLGRLFGHKYKTVCSVKSNPPSADEANKLVDLIPKDITPLHENAHGDIPPSAHLRRAEELHFRAQRIQRVIEGIGKETKTIEYEICTRCGHKIKPD